MSDKGVAFPAAVLLRREQDRVFLGGRGGEIVLQALALALGKVSLAFGNPVAAPANSTNTAGEKHLKKRSLVAHR